MIFLASDNTSPIHPKILQALHKANAYHQKSYGNDDVSLSLQSTFCTLFDTDLKVFPVFNGSASNSLAIASVCRGSEGFICHYSSHLNQDECGMPELFSGAKAIPIRNDCDKLTAEEIENMIIYAHDQGVHHVKPRAISITQSTELGTVYTIAEITAITRIAKQYQLYVHMDGARFSNAIANLNCSPSSITNNAGIDILSFGGTKNGGMFTEAVVVFNPALHHSIAYLQKHVGQLASKQRYLSIQWEAFLTDDLWLSNARHANNMAFKIANALANSEQAELIYPVQANAVFVNMNKALAEYLYDCGYVFYDWTISGKNTYRFVTSFYTTEEEIKQFVIDISAYTTSKLLSQ